MKQNTQVKPTFRQHERAPLDLYVNKIIGDEPHLARVRDISESGVYLYRLIEPQAGPDRQVGLEMKLPDSDEVIWAVGEVVRHENTFDGDAEGTAIRFTRIAAKHRDEIKRFVDARSADAWAA